MRSWVPLLLVVGVFLVLAVAQTVHSWSYVIHPTRDAAQYEITVKQLIDRGVYGYDSTKPNAYVSPGYPLFLVPFAGDRVRHPRHGERERSGGRVHHRSGVPVSGWVARAERGARPVRGRYVGVRAVRAFLLHTRLNRAG